MKFSQLTVTSIASLSLVFANTLTAGAQTSNTDQQYLSFLQSNLQSQPLALEISNNYGTQENIQLANQVCSLYSQGNTPSDILEDIVSSINNFEQLSEQQQYAIGYYLGVVFVGSANYYCPQHLQMVRTHFEQM